MLAEFRCPKCGQADPREFAFSFAVEGWATGYTAGVTPGGEVILNHPAVKTHRTNSITSFFCLKCHHEWEEDRPTVSQT